MRPLYTSRKSIATRDQVVRYRGSATTLGEDLLFEALRGLTIVKPLVGWLPNGGVIREEEKACSWAKWHCDFLQRYFRHSHEGNYRHVMLLVTDQPRTTLNILSRLEPIIGEGSITLPVFVTRVSEEDYACFEY